MNAALRLGLPKGRLLMDRLDAVAAGLLALRGALELGATVHKQRHSSTRASHAQST